MQNYNYVPYTAVASNVKGSWSQGYYVEQHSRAELQLHVPYTAVSCVQCKRKLVTRTLRRAALTSRTTTTYHIQQLCPMNDCNGKRELARRTLRRAALTCRTTTPYHIQQLCPKCKRELVTRTLRRAALTSRTTSMYTERARRFGLTSTHPVTLSRISTLSLGSNLTAIHYLCSMPRGYRSRHRVTHEIMYYLLYLSFGVSRLATILLY